MTDVPSVRMLVGNAPDVLRTLPAASVHCCVTSPPYFGLRAYGTEPQVWGGDPACGHEWREHRYYTIQTASKSSSEAFSEAGETNAQRLKDARWRIDNTCVLCGAWRGELGQEPDVDIYVEHLVAVFREVRRRPCTIRSPRVDASPRCVRRRARRVLSTSGHNDVTIDWRPTCGCSAADPVPAVVLDPFGGSGTAALVASALSRSAISIDLNPEYVDMQERRVEPGLLVSVEREDLA
jgi:DNA modification methylase